MTYRIKPLPVTVLGLPAGTILTEKERTAHKTTTEKERTAHKTTTEEYTTNHANLFNTFFELGNTPLFTAAGIINNDNPNETLTNYKGLVTAMWTENQETFITTAAGHTINLTYTIE